MKIKLVGYFKNKDVFLNGKTLHPDLSQKVFNHSPDGFNWGYGGSGPSQLALAILLEFTDQVTAMSNYQQFKREVIAALPQTDFDKEIEIDNYLN